MALDPKILQQAIDASLKESDVVVAPDEEVLKRAVSASTAKQIPQEEDIWAAPEFVQKIAPLKFAVGTGQELAEFLGNIPKLFGAKYEVPKVVETGLGEKAAAGVLEYLLGGAGAKAIPAIGKGFQALGQIPKIGKALASPMAQRALGGAAMMGVGDPEHPARAAATGLVASPAMELGFKIPSKTVDMLATAKWSPFHSMMMPHIKREFNEFLLSTGKKLGLSEEHDVDKALFGKLKDQYHAVTKGATARYNIAKKAFKDVKYPIYWKEGLRGRTMPLIKDVRDTYEKSTDSFGIKINKTMKNLEAKIDSPVDFRRSIHAAEGEALKTGNRELLESLRGIESKFDKSLFDLGRRAKDPMLSKALGFMKSADTYFKKNVVPLRSRKPVKVAEGAMKKVPTKFFQAYGKDTSKGLSKGIRSHVEELEHMSKVSPEIKEHLILDHLKEGYNNPEKFIKEYSALKKEPKELMFSKEQISRFNKFKKVYEKNPKAFQKGSYKEAILPAIGGVGALTAAFLPHSAFTAPAIGGATLGALGGAKALSMSPAAREAYISGASPIIPKAKDALRNLVMGALLGTTKK